MDGLRPSSNGLIPDRLQEWRNNALERLKEVIIEHINTRKELGYQPPKAIDVAWWYGGFPKQGDYIISHCEMSEFMYEMPELTMDDEGRYSVV